MKNEKFVPDFVREKQEDLEFLKKVDYDSIKCKVDSAISSGNTARMIETKAQIAGSYDEKMLKDRKSQVSLPFMDEEIAEFVSRYLGIIIPLDKEIKGRAKKSETIFREAYGLKTPDIATLRQSSEEYAVFEGKAQGLDGLILKYSRFSADLRKIEQQVDGCVQEYRNINSTGMLKKIKQDAGFLKKSLTEVIQKHAIPGNAAYNYHNKPLEQIEPELERFEKDDFVGKRKDAEREMKIAGDFIELLACATGKEKYAVLEEISSQIFSDFRPFEATVYLGDVAKDHAALARQLNADAADNARRYQADEVQNLNRAVADSLAKSKNVDELKAQKIRISNEYSGKADVLHQLSGQDSLRQTLSSGLSSIDKLVKEKNDAAEREKMQELAKAKIKIESDERLKREEHDKKYNFSKKEEENRALAGRVNSLEKDKKHLESENKRQEATVGQLMENMSQLAPLIQEVSNASQAQQSQINKQLSSMESTLQSAGLPKLYQEVQGLRKLVEQKYTQGTNETKLKSMIDGAVKTIDDKLNKLYEQVQKKEEPAAAKIDSAVKTIDGKIDKIYSQMQKKEEQAKKDGAVKQEQTSKCPMAEQMGGLSYEANAPKKPFEREKLNYAIPSEVSNKELMPKPHANSERLDYAIPANPTNEALRDKTVGNAPGNAQPQIHIDTYIGTMNAGTVTFGQAATAQAEQRRETGIFDLAYELQGRMPPMNTNLGRVLKRITGNENLNMLERFLSIEEFIGQNTPAVNSKDDLKWLKWTREKLVDEINFGIVGRAIRKGGAVKEQFYDIINNAVDPYIAKCENSLGRTN